MKENKNTDSKDKKNGNYFFKGAVIGSIVGIMAAVVMRKRFLLFTVAGFAIGGYFGSNITKSNVIAKEITSQFVNYSKKLKS